MECSRSQQRILELIKLYATMYYLSIILVTINSDSIFNLKSILYSKKNKKGVRKKADGVCYMLER